MKKRCLNVYKTTNLITGKFYIGQSVFNDINYLGSGIILNQSILKHGRLNFKKLIILYYETLKLLNNGLKY